MSSAYDKYYYWAESHCHTFRRSVACRRRLSLIPRLHDRANVELARPANVEQLVEPA